MAIVAVGTELAGYRIEELIGRGGMGVVYRGADLRLGRAVAIKLIAADLASDPAVRQRFEREARLMAALDHPNVLPIYAAGEEDGSLYLVMRYVPGTDLAAMLRHDGRLAPVPAVRVIEQVASALDDAHQAGLVHRDIKPANVLLAGDHVYLSDFGIGRAIESATRITDTNDWLGTVDFCSPEQFRGERADGRSDVYSLGCLLHTVLTGTPPHHRETTPATMFAHLNELPPAPSRTPGVTAALDPVVARALAKHPADRYPTAGALARAARSAVDGAQATRHRDHTAASSTRRTGRTKPHGAPTARHRPIRTKLDLRPPRLPAPPPGSSRRTGALIVAGLVLLAAVALLVGAVLGGGSSRPAPAGPVTGAEASGVLRAFAGAYGRRDAQALSALLAPEVTRVDAQAVEHGRTAVLTLYRAELADASIVGYRLSDVRLETGWVARATGHYEVVRTGRSDLRGAVTFGFERVASRPVIALIAVGGAG